MKATELIKELQGLMDIYGDLPIYCYYDGGYGVEAPNRVEYESKLNKGAAYYLSGEET